VKNPIRSLRRFARKQIQLAQTRLQPDRFITDQVSIYEQGKSVPGGIDLHTLYPAQTFTPAHDDHRRFVEASPEVDKFCCERKPIFTAKLHNVKFYRPLGLLLTQDDRVITESGALDWRIRGSKLMSRPTPKPTVTFRKAESGSYATVWGLLAHNYFHWMVECLPRLYSLADYTARTGEPLTLILPQSEAKGYHRASLDYCLPEGARVEYLPDDDWFGFESFVLPSYVTTWYVAAVPKPHLDYVRGRIFARVGLPAEHKPDKHVYISRRSAADRRILNEDALIPMLERHGFEIVQPEHLSFDDQVRLFHRAKTILAPHGAGLSNILFAPPNASVIELSLANTRPYFYYLADSLGQNFYYVLGQAGTYSDNLQIDLEKIEKRVNEVLRKT